MGVRELGLDMSTMQKEGHLMEVSLHFVPQCSCHKLVLRRLTNAENKCMRKSPNAKVCVKIPQMSELSSASP